MQLTKPLYLSVFLDFLDFTANASLSLSLSVSLPPSLPLSLSLSSKTDNTYNYQFI